MNNTENVALTIHYDGEKLKNHQMELESFVISLEGFNNLFHEIAKELGLEQENFKINISPLENGGVKTKLLLFVTFVGTAVGGHLFNKTLDDLKLYERTGLRNIVMHFSKFVGKKLDPDNENNINKLTKGLDHTSNRIMINPNIHKNTEIFASVLNYEAEKIEINSPLLVKKIEIAKEQKNLLSSPFRDDNANEEVDENIKILILEGPRSIDDEWTFIEKQEASESNKQKTLKAEVLDANLLRLGRNKCLSELEDKELTCTMLIKKIKKPGNKKYSVKKYITKCEYSSELFLNVNYRQHRK